MSFYLVSLFVIGPFIGLLGLAATGVLHLFLEALTIKNVHLREPGPMIKADYARLSLATITVVLLATPVLLCFSTCVTVCTVFWILVLTGLSVLLERNARAHLKAVWRCFANALRACGARSSESQPPPQTDQLRRLEQLLDLLSLTDTDRAERSRLIASVQDNVNKLTQQCQTLDLKRRQRDQIASHVAELTKLEIPVDLAARLIELRAASHVPVDDARHAVKETLGVLECTKQVLSAHVSNQKVLPTAEQVLALAKAAQNAAEKGLHWSGKT